MHVINLLGFFLGENPLADDQSNRDINSVAGVLKLYFRGLENPLFPKERFNDLISCVSKWAVFFFPPQFFPHRSYLTNQFPGKGSSPISSSPPLLHHHQISETTCLGSSVTHPPSCGLALRRVGSAPEHYPGSIEPKSFPLSSWDGAEKQCQLTEGKEEAVSVEMLTVFWLLALGLFHHLCYLGEKGKRR